MRTARLTSPAALGRALREARLSRGISQRKMAHDLGVSQRYIVELEAGKPTKALERLFEYMREAGVSLYADIADAEPHR